MNASSGSSPAAGGAKQEQGKKGCSSCLTPILLLVGLVLLVRWVVSPGQEKQAAATSAPTPTFAPGWMTTKAPIPTRAPATPTPTARLEWVNDLYAVNDIILGHCEILKESSFVFGVAPEARAGLTDQELYTAIYDIAFRWCVDGVGIVPIPRADGIMEIHMSGAYLRDGIRMARGMDLSAEEHRCLQQIRQVVAELQRNHPNGDLDIETAIYDYISDHVVYRSYKDFPEGDQRRRDCTSAVNAFTKGFGNCQAYSDLFYIMGTEAGLYVNYLCGTAEGEGHEWNIITLDGRNLMVDVTFGDTATKDAPLPDHFYMNFGLDRCKDREWLPSAFAYDFEARTNDAYTYYRNAGASSGYAAPNLDNAINYCIQRRRQGYTTAEVLIPNQSISKQTLETALARKRIPWQYWYWHDTPSGNTWFFIHWVS